MQTDRHAALEALHIGIRGCLPRFEPSRLASRRSPDSPSVAELIGLLLMDLDLLSSGSSRGRGFLPDFATEFMNKRLARRLTEKYKGRNLETEFDRRFASAQTPVSEDPAQLAHVLVRMRSRLSEIESVLC